jgi:hypothetical protein
MSDDVIELKSLIKQLPQEDLGVYEPISGLMMLNISKSAFAAASERFQQNACTDDDKRLAHTINHEAYHFAQATASGYLFRRNWALSQCLLASLKAQAERQAADNLKFKELDEKYRANVGDDPALNRRVDRLLAMLAANELAQEWEDRAAPGDNSIAGVLLPEFFTILAEAEKIELEKNVCGLSIRGVIEGSAIVNSNFVTHSGEDCANHIEAELSTLPALYGELYYHTKSLVGERTLELLLPTAALSLCYSKPHMAYCSLLAELYQSAVGEGLEAGRRIAEALPSIEAAGPVIGNAVEARKQYDDYVPYDKIIEQLGSGAWGVSCYSFLADPTAMQPMHFPLGIVLQDGAMGVIEDWDLLGRLTMMAIVMRVRGRRRMQRQIHEYQMSWANEMRDRFFAWAHGVTRWDEEITEDHIEKIRKMYGLKEKDAAPAQPSTEGKGS